MPGEAPPPLTAIPIGEQLEAARRELKYRERVYPRRVEAGHLTQRAATYQLRCMQAIIDTLEKVAGEGRLL
jgi:hypothetical protein